MDRLKSAAVVLSAAGPRQHLVAVNLFGNTLTGISIGFGIAAGFAIAG
jgi:hypothetical protein